MADDHNVIGTSKSIFDSKECSDKECKLYNLLTEAMVFSHIQSLSTLTDKKYWTDTSICFMPNEGYDVILRNGYITVENVYSIISSQLRYNIIEVAGQTIISALEHSANAFIAKGSALHMFGVRVEYNLSASSDKRVKSVQVLCTKCLQPRYEPLNKSEFYNIIISDNLFSGFRGYKFQEDRDQNLRKLPLNDAFTLLNYLSEARLIHKELEGRITFINTKKKTHF